MAPKRYQEAGVDVEAGRRLVERIAPLARATRRPEVLGGLGAFGALWRIPAGRYRDLVLVSGTDGVGTKLVVAQAAGRHGTIGIDLVAMCVNDVLCAGAEPFFFLDYFATGKLEEGTAAEVIAGIAEGCDRAGCALVGGETAEMPGVYEPGVYDLAGFCVGGVERDELLDPARVRAGDALVALPSSGLHSNGYSLVRRLLFDEAGLSVDSPFPGLPGRSVADVVLEPTRIYVKPVLALMREVEVHSICHITGGGYEENVPRMLPDHLAAKLDRSSWELPPVFASLAELGSLSDEDLLGTFNCGIGMILAVPPERADDALAHLRGAGEQPFVVGEVVPRADGSGLLWA